MTSQLGHRLVIGKFYPPHRGHQHLIETAARECATVTVLVMAARGETVPLADRVAWLRACFTGPPDAGQSDSVSSEPYGPELAAWFDAADRPVDPARRTVPVSATRIRADLPGRSWVPLTGSLPGRLAMAVAVADEILAQQRRFGPPITAALVPSGGGS
jgi:HTH-type transcriptional repressor of NAD biosynthesis genes